MKTFAALIRRYVLATAAIVLLVGGLLVGQIFYVGFKSNAVDATGYRVGALADALKQTETGLQWGETSAESFDDSSPRHPRGCHPRGPALCVTCVLRSPLSDAPL